MTPFGQLHGCACCKLNRRLFLASGCATCAGTAGLMAAGSRVYAAEDAAKTRVRIVFALHAVKQPGPDWPNIGYDFAPVMKRIEEELARRCPGFEFLVSMAAGPEQAKQIVEADKATAIDGYLVCQMNCWNRVVQTIAETGKPVLYADYLYAGSGGFLVYTASFLRNKAPNVGFVASSKIEDLAAAVQCFQVVKKGGSVADFVAATAKVRIQATPKPGDLTCKPDELKPLSIDECRKRMRESKILAVGGGWPGIVPAIQEQMGITVVNVPFAELNDAWKAADKDQSREIADRWAKAAAAVVDIAPGVLQDSAAMYLAQKAILQKHGANAITINCLGGFYGKHIHAYPCLGFFELLNEGLIGACECDLRSTATMVAMTALTQGRPGYISDPVLDIAHRHIIYAHCVASNRVFGPQGAANPFTIMTHSEDRQGASVRSTLPAGYMTTTVEFAPERKEILFHRAKSVGNSTEDRACRTKLVAEPVGDFEKLFTEWDRWGWHRVTYYGDLKEPVYALAEVLGWKVTEEA
jgi:hypothetical protein